MQACGVSAATLPPPVSWINAYKKNIPIGITVLANKACYDAIGASKNKGCKVREGLEKSKVDREESRDCGQSLRMLWPSATY